MSYVERLVVSDETRATILYDEHLIRYRFASASAVGKTVLDIACGSGYGAELLAQAGAERVVGIDVDESAIKEAQENFASAKIEFRLGDATRLALEDKSIDLITSFETIEHLPDVETYLAELKRVIKDEGLVFISTPNREVFGQKNPFHIKEFTRREFEETLRRYFPQVILFEQKNGLSSAIIGKGEAMIEMNDSGAKALYFIAVCSNREIAERFKSVASLNVAALERWEHNPGWRLINALYRILQKLRIVKG